MHLHLFPGFLQLTGIQLHQIAGIFPNGALRQLRPHQRYLAQQSAQRLFADVLLDHCANIGLAAELPLTTVTVENCVRSGSIIADVVIWHMRECCHIPSWSALLDWM